MSLLVCAVLSLTGCSEEMLDDRDKSVSTTELVTTEEDTGITEKDAAEYVESCRSLTEKYTNLIRNIDNYKGVDYKVNAKVVQAMGDGNIVIELWGETGGELWETMSMIEHYES